MTRLLALALLLLPSFAHAQAYVGLRGFGLRLEPIPSAPANFSAGRVGLWSPSNGPNANKPLWRNADGTDSLMAAGSAGYGLVADEGTPLAARGTLNIIGSAVTCVDNSGASRTDCTISAGSGTVTSVGMTVPSWLSVSGSPVTSSGTLALTASTGQTANRFLATPDGSTGAVSLRAIVAADIPSLAESKITNLTTDLAAKGSLASANTWTASQNVAAVPLTDAATVATDASLGNTFTVTLGGNRTLGNPTGVVAGGTYQWIVTQDGTGSRTLAYGANFKWPSGTAPTLTTTATTGTDLISCVAKTTSFLACNAMLDVR